MDGDGGLWCCRTQVVDRLTKGQPGRGHGQEQELQVGAGGAGVKESPGWSAAWSTR